MNKNIILLCDGGSTKADWCLMDEQGGELASCKTRGLNPYHLSDEEMRQVLSGELASFNESPSQVWFYGSGVTEAMKPRMRKLLQQQWPMAEVHAESDMLGAARAVLGHQAGVAVIMGTGSNSCCYDGRQIVRNVPPLGYILGDEGSGTAIGKAFLRYLYRKDEAANLRNLFEQQTGLAYADVIDRVYRQPQANTFLASLCPFVLEALKQEGNKGLHEEIDRVFADFFRMLSQGYADKFQSGENIPVGFVGSIAHYFSHYYIYRHLTAPFVLTQVLRSPMEGLMAYHKLQ